MAWLLVFGLLHFYFVWWGDILSLYAPVGMLAFLFRRMATRKLIYWAIVLILMQTLLFAGFAADVERAAAAAATPGATPRQLADWAAMQEGFGTYTAEQLRATLALYLGPWTGIVNHMLTDELLTPVEGFWLFGAETLAYMLLGMAALKSGFLTGAWSGGAYVRTMAIGYGIGIPLYAFLAWVIVANDFDVPILIAASIAASVPLRPVMIVATAALIILLTRRGGALVERIAATGRAAFTNYLGTSLLMTTFFYGYGFGFYGTMRRVELWLPVVGMWLIMLFWSKPWLDRFRYGPFEWLWRSLARRRFEPMRKERGA